MTTAKTSHKKSHKKTQYGPLFWLALVSFIVPLVVAAKAFEHVHQTSKPTPHPDASGVDHALWDYLLKKYANHGLVDYEAMSRDHLLLTYIRQLGSARPENLANEDDRLALLFNAYNAMVIGGVITHHIHDSVNSFGVDGVGFFDLKEHILFGRTVSLNTIEQQLIRGHYQEPRVHVALVCGARSCPAIRPEAYLGSGIERQLEDQSRLFANDRRYVDFDPVGKKLLLSPILRWYGGDWDPVGGYLPWLAERVKDPKLKSAITQAIQGDVGVSFLQYDWSLNSQAPVEASAPAVQPSNFGSGSIPNR